MKARHSGTWSQSASIVSHLITKILRDWAISSSCFGGFWGFHQQGALWRGTILIRRLDLDWVTLFRTSCHPQHTFARIFETFSSPHVERSRSKRKGELWVLAYNTSEIDDMKRGTGGLQSRDKRTRRIQEKRQRSKALFFGTKNATTITFYERCCCSCLHGSRCSRNSRSGILAWLYEISQYSMVGSRPTKYPRVSGNLF